MHAFLLDRDAERGKETKTERHAVKRTNLPSRHANESSDATVFPSFFQGSLLYAHLLSPCFQRKLNPRQWDSLRRNKDFHSADSDVRKYRGSTDSERETYGESVLPTRNYLFLLCWSWSTEQGIYFAKNMKRKIWKFSWTDLSLLINFEIYEYFSEYSIMKYWIVRESRGEVEAFEWVNIWISHGRSKIHVLPKE